jgi:hypothetical protein
MRLGFDAAPWPSPDGCPCRDGAGVRYARCRNGKIGGKIHVVFDPDRGVPVFFEISPGKVNDITIARNTIPLEHRPT